MQMKPDSLMKQARKMDSTALAELHNQLYPLVYRYVRFRLEDDQACEDITSDVFLRFISALQQNGRQIEDARAWMLGTASNLVHDYYRLKYRRPIENIEDHESILAPQTTEAMLDRKFTLEEIRGAMRHITAEQQHVLALRFSQELSLEETAQLIGKSVNAVKVLQFRALGALRRLLTEKSGE
jgi:RNA polymerase sigma-70 factor (ECF subfamily)